MHTGPVDLVQQVIEYRGFLIYAGKSHYSDLFRSTVVDQYYCYRTSTTANSLEEVIRRAKYEVDQGITFQRQWLRDAIKLIEEERQA